jgi:hypothetical protein
MKNLTTIMMLVFLLIPTLAMASIPQKHWSYNDIESTIIRYAEIYEVKKSYALALAHIESRLSDEIPFRTGPIGHFKYAGPFGINRCYIRERGWNVDDVETNIMIGCRCLTGINDINSLKRRLSGGKNRKGAYNASFDSAYWGAILSAINKYEKKYN